ncbi:MAG TPA: Crp/Fnr family transcriptional regulator [Gammaproteobacteria bacterium]|nr:Crp/Fnr family transcriptional regulator [Gammaproteobacteria bacterium]
MYASPQDNYLLKSLPEEVYARLLPELEPVQFFLGQSVYESGNTMEYVYFPADCIVSLVHLMNNDTSAEIAIVGFEGVVGISLFLGGGSAPSRGVVQNAGTAYRLKASRLNAEFDAGGGFQKILLCYTQALIAQMSQTAVCNRHHTLEQQLCRWVLLSIDRLPTDEMKMTELLVANMLGIRDGAVSSVAEKLQFARLIQYRHGNLKVLDRTGLEILVCECYDVVKNEYLRLLPGMENHQRVVPR